MKLAVLPPPRSPTPKTDPNQASKILTGRDYLSYSAISTYQRCPLRYRFQYVDGLEPEFTSSSLVFGSAIHAALECHFDRVMDGSLLPDLDTLLDVYDQAWKLDASNVRFGKNETFASLRELARRMLAAFLDSELSKLESRILGVEEELRGPIIPDVPDILGRIDLIVADQGDLRLIDFKTSRSRWSEAQLQEAAPQQLLYAELARPLARAAGAEQIRIEWIVLTKGKQPKVERHTLVPHRRQIERTMAIVRRVWKAIEARHFYPSPSTMNCSSCPFQKAFAAWEG